MARRAGDADSRLRGAKLVNLNSSTNGSFRQRNDLDDLIRFNVAQRSSVNLQVSGIARRNNVDVQLYRFVRPAADVIRSIGRIDFRQLRGQQRNANFQLVGQSTQSSNRNESITTDLNQGEYFVRFLRRQGNRTNYTAQLSGTPILTSTPSPSPNPLPSPSPSPSPNPSPSPSPSPSPGPTPIPVIPLTGSTTGVLATTETEKRYSINVGTAGDYLINLAGLSGDADLQLLAADGTTVLRTSSNSGTDAERFIQPLDGGQYLLRVLRKTGNAAATNFALNFTKLTDNVANTEANANNMGSSVASITAARVNYVVTNGKDSPVDFFKFTLPTRAFVRVNLKGRPAENDALFGNLDIDLYEQGQSPSSGVSSASLGNASESFGGTLAGGKTYILRVRPADGSNTGSTYQLSLALNIRSSDPSIVRDVISGSGSSEATNFTEVGGLAYFSTNSINNQGIAKTTLWQSTGTLDGTKRISDFDSGTALKSFTKVGNQLYFVATTAASGTELWTSDGNAARIVADIVPGAGSSNPEQLTAVNTDLYFVTKAITTDPGNPTAQRLWRVTQGSNTPVDLSASNATLAPATAQEFKELTNVNGQLFFTAKDRVVFGGIPAPGDTELWRVNSTTSALEQMQLSPDEDGGSDPSNLTNVDGTLFLTANVEVPGGLTRNRELIRINTFTIAPYSPSTFGPTNSSAATLYNLNDVSSAEAENLLYVSATKTLYFAAANTGEGLELRRVVFTNPATDALTTPELVQNINASSGSSSPSNLVQLGNRVVFSAFDGTTTDLWITNDTGLGAVKLSSLTGLSGLSTLSNLKQFTVVNDKLFFVATDATAGEELREITLTSATAGTLDTFDIRPGAASSLPNSLTAVGGQLFFVANNGTDGNEPWSLLA